VNSNFPDPDDLKKLSGYIESRNYDEANKIALSLIIEYPKHTFGWKALGILYDQAGKKDDAIKVKKKSVELNPLDYEAHCNLGNSYKKIRKFKKAEESYRFAIEIKEDFVLAYLNLGTLLYETFRFNEAEKLFEKLVELTPDNDEAFRVLGVIYHKLNKFEEAEENFRHAISLNPNNATTYFDLGNLLSNNNYNKYNIEDSIVCYKKAIQIDSNINCQTNFASAYLKNKNPKKALTLLESELNQNPNNIKAYGYKYIALRGLGYYHKADDLISFPNLVKKINSQYFSDKNIIKFNKDLKKDLINHPGRLLKKDLKNWSIRGASVVDNLFKTKTSSILEFENLLKKCLKDYVSKLPDDNKHPFLMNKTKNCELKSCWVNFLGPGDFQSNHIHINGSITGVYYLDEPEIEIENKHAGWIEFNRAGSNLPHFGEERGIELMKPSSGMFIFFPSYIWHGTIPHKNLYDRISISFDFIFN
jgi:uncharacterized protein (TIGR02466 family)